MVHEKPLTSEIELIWLTIQRMISCSRCQRKLADFQGIDEVVPVSADRNWLLECIRRINCIALTDLNFGFVFAKKNTDRVSIIKQLSFHQISLVQLLQNTLRSGITGFANTFVQYESINEIDIQPNFGKLPTKRKLKKIWEINKGRVKAKQKIYCSFTYKGCRSSYRRIAQRLFSHEQCKSSLINWTISCMNWIRQWWIKSTRLPLYMALSGVCKKCNREELKKFPLSRYGEAFPPEQYGFATGGWISLSRVKPAAVRIWDSHKFNFISFGIHQPAELTIFRIIDFGRNRNLWTEAPRSIVQSDSHSDSAAITPVWWLGNIEYLLLKNDNTIGAIFFLYIILFPSKHIVPGNSVGNDHTIVPAFSDRTLYENSTQTIYRSWTGDRLRRIHQIRIHEGSQSSILLLPSGSIYPIIFHIRIFFSFFPAHSSLQSETMAIIL